MILQSRKRLDKKPVAQTIKNKGDKYDKQEIKEQFHNKNRTATIQVIERQETTSFTVIYDQNKLPLTTTTDRSLSSFEHDIEDLLSKAEKLTYSGNYEESTISEVAQIGANLFQDLFPKDSFRNELLSLISNRDITSLIALNDSITLPWALMYIGKDLSQLNPQNFLGMKCPITTIPRKACSAESQHRTPPDTSKGIRLKYAWDDSLESIVKKETVFISGLNNNKDYSSPQVTQVSELIYSKGNIENTRTFAQEINDQDPHIIHFSCHFESNKTISKNRFRLRENTFISYADLKSEKVRFESNPVIFFNACDVARMQPRMAISFLDHCIQMGARSIVAPLCLIKDSTAASMAKYFYIELFSNKLPLDEALFNARLQMFKKEKNLTGLAYSVYGFGRLEYSN